MSMAIVVRAPSEPAHPASILAGLGRLLRRAVTWRRRARARRSLHALDDRLLRDIGLTRGDALYETLKSMEEDQ